MAIVMKKSLDMLRYDDCFFKYIKGILNNSVKFRTINDLIVYLQLNYHFDDSIYSDDINELSRYYKDHINCEKYNRIMDILELIARNEYGYNYVNLRKYFIFV